MKIKTNCTKCGKTIEVHSDKWLTSRCTDKELIESRLHATMLLMKEKNECYKCYFGIKQFIYLIGGRNEN